MIVVYSHVPVTLLASPRKSPIGRPTHHPKDRHLAEALVRKTEASRETVGHADIVIDLYVKGSRILDEFCCPLEIVGRNKAPRTSGIAGIARAPRWEDVGERNFCEDCSSNRTARRWVVDRNQCAALICRLTKIPTAKGRGGHSAIEKLPLVIIDTEEITKEESLVPDDRPANVGAIIVIHARRLWRDRLEERLGGQRADTVDFISSAVKLIGARFEDHICYCAIGSSQLGVVIAGCYINGLNRFNRGNVNRQQTGSFVVVQAFKLQVVCQTRLPVHLGPQTILRVEEGGMLAVRACRARNQVKQSLKVSIERQRKLFGLPFFNLSPNVCAICLQYGKLGSNYHCFLGRARLQHKVYTRVRVHKDIHT